MTLSDFAKTHEILLLGILFCLTIITLFSIGIDFNERENNKVRELQLQMAVRGYCLTSVKGSAELQYQPCSKE